MKYRILGEVFGSGRRKEEIQVTFPSLFNEERAGNVMNEGERIC